MCCDAGINVLELLYELVQLLYYAGFAYTTRPTVSVGTSATWGPTSSFGDPFPGHKLR